MTKLSCLNLALTVVIWSSFSGCQLVLGDYRVDASELAPSGTRVCKVDEYRCNGATLEVCNRNRSDWIAFETCSSENLCNLNSASCQSCAAGKEYQCNGQYLLECTADARWRQVESNGDCGTAALCSAAERRCIPETCRAGEHRCNGAALERCAPGRDGWQKVIECADCDASLSGANQQAAEGKPVTCGLTCDRATATCEAPNCDTPGSYRCYADDIQLQRCSEAFQWKPIVTCTNQFLCNEAEAQCDPPCTKDQRRCTKNTLEKCSGDQTGWDPVRECRPDELCDPGQPDGQECVPGPCPVHARRCNSTFVERCDGFTWKREIKCKSPCNTLTPACSSG